MFYRKRQGLIHFLILYRQLREYSEQEYLSYAQSFFFFIIYLSIFLLTNNIDFLFSETHSAARRPFHFIKNVEWRLYNMYARRAGGEGEKKC